MAQRTVKIVFDEIPPLLNKTMTMAQRHWSLYSKVKAYWKILVMAKTARIKRFKNPVDIEMTITFATNRRRDIDNMMGCFKYILDGLKCLPDDNENIVRSLTINTPRVVKGVEKCEVIIKERDM